MKAYNVPLFMQPVINHRYFSYSVFIEALRNVLDNYSSSSTQLVELGKSVLDVPINGLTLGTGKTKILIWSQMHGNESTTTRSLLMFVDWFLKSDFQLNFKLYIIPVLNPDGLTRWTRENANSVDLNRDAQDLSQPESRILRNAFDEFEPDYCFNLHDQRTIYGTPDGSQAIQCSFLAPAADESRKVTSARLKAMQVINNMVDSIHHLSTGVIGRYGDVYNPKCVGDTFQSLDVPTILFEAGQSSDNYMRDDTRNIIFESLKAALIGFVESTLHLDQVLESYNNLARIETNYCDVLIKNVPSHQTTVDLSVMYREEVYDGKLYFIPILSGINDASVKNGHRVIDFKETDGVLDFEISHGQCFSSRSLEIDIFY